MTDKNLATGSEAGKETSLDPAVTEANNVALSLYGITPDEPEPAAEHPAQDDKKSDESSTGGKGGIPPAPAAAPAPAAEGSPKPGDEKLLAKKYKTPEALELGYVELQGQTTKLAQEKAQLEAELKKFTTSPPPAAGPAVEEPATPAPAKALTFDEMARSNPAVSEAFEQLSESLGDEEANTLKNIFSLMMQQNAGQLAELNAKLAKSEDVVGQIAADRQTQELEDLVNNFEEAHVEAKDPDIKAERIKIRQEVLANAHDPNFLLQLELDAAKGRKMSTLVDKILAARTEGLREQIKAELLASGIAVGGGAGLGSGGAEVGDKTKEAKSAYGLD